MWCYGDPSSALKHFLDFKPIDVYIVVIGIILISSCFFQMIRLNIRFIQNLMESELFFIVYFAADWFYSVDRTCVPKSLFRGVGKWQIIYWEFSAEISVIQGDSLWDAIIIYDCLYLRNTSFDWVERYSRISFNNALYRNDRLERAENALTCIEVGAICPIRWEKRFLMPRYSKAIYSTGETSAIEIPLVWHQVNSNIVLKLSLFLEKKTINLCMDII